MPVEISSLVIGTSGLSLMAITSAWLATTRAPARQSHLKQIQRLVFLGVLLQAGHFAEELLTGFHTRFPEWLGLTPWPMAFFVSLNLIWIAVWLLCIVLLDRYPRLAIFPIWLLAIASAVNAVAHPVMALFANGYFPGLWSSPFVGILGIVLLRVLVPATHKGASPGASKPFVEADQSY